MKVSHNMAILFWHNLSKKNNNGEAPVYCRITINQQRGQFSKGIFITEDKWDGDAKIIKGSSEQVKTWNNDLAQTKGKLITIYNQLQSLHELVTPEMIINKFKGITPQRKTLLHTFKEYNQQLKERTEAKIPTFKKKTWTRFEITKKATLPSLTM